MTASRFLGPVLVYAPDRGIGDLMWHLPTIRAIAATTPEGQVVLVARPSSRASEVLAVERQIVAIEPSLAAQEGGNWEIEFFNSDRYNAVRNRRAPQGYTDGAPLA